MLSRCLRTFGGCRTRARRGGVRPRRWSPGFEALEARSLLTIGSGALAPLTDLAAADADPAARSARIVNGTVTSAFPSVGIVGDRSGGFCTGTLIDDNHVLTAGHCAEGLGATQGRFTINGTTYATSQIFVHPNYNGNRIGEDAANDIAIFRLDRNVANVTPSPIFRSVPQVGQILTLVGYGAGGTGNSGHDGSFGTKRVGTTPIDAVSSRLIRWEFDNNREANTAPGDSGGPAFLNVNNVYYVAGVTSGGDQENAGLGDSSYDTRVDYYASWIDSIVGVTPPPAPTPEPGPEPGPAADDYGNTFDAATSVALTNTGQATVRGNIEVDGDLDMFKFTAPYSGRYTITLSAISRGHDTVLAVYNSRGRLVGYNDDSGSGTDSRLRLRLQAGQTYYVEAKGYDDSTGGYELQFNPTNRVAKLASPGTRGARSVAGMERALVSSGEGDVSWSAAAPTARRLAAPSAAPLRQHLAPAADAADASDETDAAPPCSVAALDQLFAASSW